MNIELILIYALAIGVALVLISFSGFMVLIITAIVEHQRQMKKNR